jgi:hypothetical protein
MTTRFEGEKAHVTWCQRYRPRRGKRRKCSFCAEEVLVDARKCKPCGEFVNRPISVSVGVLFALGVVIAVDRLGSAYELR